MTCIKARGLEEQRPKYQHRGRAVETRVMLSICFAVPVALGRPPRAAPRGARLACCAQRAPATAVPAVETATTAKPSRPKRRPRRNARATTEAGGASAREVRVAELSRARAARMKALWEDPAFRERMSRVRRTFSEEERAARAARLRARWEDPAWRASMSGTGTTPDASAAARRASAAARARWADPAYRARMAASRAGRVAWNKGVSPSGVTRLRMSVARRGVPKSAETRRRMSEARQGGEATDSWRMAISEGKKGKTKEYFQMRREFRALHRDLKLWSDLYRAQHGRLPNAKDCETVVAPMMVFRIRRYLTLRENFAQDEKAVLKNKIIE